MRAYGALEEHGFYWKMAKDMPCFESIVWRNENILNKKRKNNVPN